MMTKQYRVKRNGKFLKTLGSFESYERARQAVRKYMRKTIKGTARFNYDGLWDTISRNPTSLSAAGFRIVSI